MNSLWTILSIGFGYMFGSIATFQVFDQLDILPKYNWEDVSARRIVASIFFPVAIPCVIFSKAFKYALSLLLPDKKGNK